MQGFESLRLGLSRSQLSTLVNVDSQTLHVMFFVNFFFYVIILGTAFKPVAACVQLQTCFVDVSSSLKVHSKVKISAQALVATGLNFSGIQIQVLVGRVLF